MGWFGAMVRGTSVKVIGNVTGMTHSQTIYVHLA